MPRQVQNLEHVVLDFIENGIRAARVQPLNLGGISGAGGGVGSPPGGFIGQLPQTRVSYDSSELATLDTPGSGMSLLDNLNHIRARILTLENETSSLVVEDWDGNPSISNVERIIFSGAVVSNLGSGRALVVVSGGGSGTPFTGSPDSVVVTDGAGELDTYPWLVVDPSFEAIEFGADVVGKETNAGKVFYDESQGFLTLLGAGTAQPRKVKVFEELYVEENLYVNGGTRLDPNKQVTNGDSHDHNGGDGGQINHTTLSNIGTNTHTQIDTHIANTSNPHSVTALQAGAIPSDGWLDTNSDTWTFASADDPVYQIYVTGNANGSPRYKAGNRLKCTSNSVVFYGIIVKVGSYDGGNNRTPIDVYGGTDYDLANNTITNKYISLVKSPDGFPMSPDKWTISVVSSGTPTKTSPTAAVWYGGANLSPTGPSIEIPIGIWRVWYRAVGEANANLGAVTNLGCRVTLSTSNSSESDSELSIAFTVTLPASATALQRGVYIAEKSITLTTKTTYYLNIFTGNSGVGSIFFNPSDVFKNVINAVCAYL